MWLLCLALPAALARPPQSRFDLELISLSRGLPQSTGLGLAQGPDGMLWIATFGGLARFDGLSFMTVDAALSPELTSVRFTSVAVIGDRLWAGMEYGTIFEQPLSLDAPPAQRAQIDGPVWDIVQYRGEIFAAGQGGVYRVGGSSVLSCPRSTDLIVASGSLFAACTDGLYQNVGDRFERRAEGEVVALASDNEGGLWLATPDGLSLHGAPKRITDSPVSALAIDNSSRVWITSGEELSMLGRTQDLRASAMGERVSLLPERFPLQSTAREILAGREGEIWVGTELRGVAVVRNRPFTRICAEDGLPARGVGPVVVKDGELFAASGPGAPVRIGPSGVETLQIDGVDWEWIWEMQPTSDGWLIGQDHEVVRIVGDKVAARYPVGHSPQAILQEPDETLWIGTNNGTFSVDPSGLREISGIPSRRVATIERAEDGSIWFGHPFGLTILERGELRTLTSGEGLPAGEVRVVHFLPEGDVLVGTYGGGLGIWRGGRWQRIDTSHGLQDNTISAVVLREGWLWLNGNRGVSRVPLGDIYAFADGKSHRIRSELFATGEGNGGRRSSSAITPDGRIAFPTIDGLVLIEPDEVISPTPPEIVWLSAEVDGQPIDPEIEARLPPGPGDFDVAFTAPLLSRPAMARFSFRWAPDGPWTDTLTRELRFRSLPPGRHVLEVRAAGPDNAWSAPKALAFTVEPHLWQIPLVRLLGTLSLVALSLFLSSWGNTVVRRRNRALQREVDSRRAVESALALREAHYRRLFEASRDGLLVVSRDRGHITDCNPAAASLFGKPVSEIVGVMLSSLLPGDGQTRTLSRPNAPEATVLVATTTLDAHSDLVSVVDVSGVVALQQRLARTGRLEAIGRLAGGIAHDFNNLLTAVIAETSSLKETPLARDPQASESLEIVSSASARGAELTRRLLAFARRQILAEETVDPGESLRKLAALLKPLLRDDIALRIEVAPGERAVEVDGSQLDLAIMNLAINGAQSMKNGGTLTVSVRDEGGEVVVSVQDEGAGISPEDLPHIFEPFFTTRADGNGLGLASVHGFVIQSKGRIEVETKLGQGTRFDIRLPRSTKRPAPPPQPAASELRESLRVLLCDDDPQVRRAVQRMLLRAGHRVEAASDAKDALAIHARERFDILVTDIRMPGKSGIELAREITEQNPAIGVILCTGYAEDLRPRDSIPWPVLLKPFRPDELLRQIQSVRETRLSRG